MMNATILQQFHPKFQPLVKVVLSEKIGIGSGNIKLNGVASGQPTGREAGNCDRFRLIIPYAGQQITWNVVFNSVRPEFGPNFAFDDDSFLADPEVEYLEETVPSLVAWNPRDPKALMNVISELLETYRKHQVALLEHVDRSRLQFEYSSLVGQAEVAEGDIEILVGSGRQRVASFLIKLKVDFSAVPLPLGTTGEAAALLAVSFHPPAEGGRITPQLLLSPAADLALEGASGMGINLPPFPPGGSCLMDYVPAVTNMLQDRVDAAAVSYERRHDLVNALMQHFEYSAHEYDSIQFRYTSFLLEWRDFYFMLHINLPLNFPREKPEVIFQSVYHATFGKPYRLRFDDFPYSARWDVKRIAESMITAITENVESFQRKSVQTASCAYRFSD